MGADDICIECGNRASGYCDKCEIKTCDRHRYNIGGKYGEVCDKCFEEIKQERR